MQLSAQVIYLLEKHSVLLHHGRCRRLLCCLGICKLPLQVADGLFKVAKVTLLSLLVLLFSVCIRFEG
eukprot:XP_001708625.1 Hypothetical protein GL50803_35309 [Giardia lamblia ATCC 50803]